MSLDWMFGGPKRPNPDRDAAYLGPSSVFRNWPVATGPGMHTDEASSALPDMGKLLSPVERQALTTTRENPTSSGYSQTIAPRNELMRIAYEVTGMWGSGSGSYRVIDFDRPTLRRLPAFRDVRENPQMTIDFWARMKQLEESLEKFQQRVGGRYDATLQERKDRRAKKAIDAGKPPPEEDPRDAWRSDIEKMIKAVQFVLDQEIAAVTTHKLSLLDTSKDREKRGLPFGMRWGVLAPGNGKIPYTSTSGLPMSSCAGAGACGVAMTTRTRGEEAVREKARKAKARAAAKAAGIKYVAPSTTAKGWCYSFKAWRRGAAFTRQFLNTLADTVDREAAIYRGTPVGKHPGNDETNDAVYERRVLAALRGSDVRIWQQYCKQLILEQTKSDRTGGRTGIVRLFVDGDIGSEDTIMAWMQVCRDLAPDGRDIVGTGLGHVELYGYSKNWMGFLNVDGIFKKQGSKWPTNYTVNMSSGSVYAGKDLKNAPIATAMEKLPITRGYFEAVDLKKYVVELRAQTDLLIATAKKQGKTPRQIVVPMPKEKSPIIAGLNFNQDRIRDFVLLQTVQTREDVLRYFPDTEAGSLKSKNTPEKLMHFALSKYLDKLSWDPEFGTLVRRELRFDAGEKEFVEQYEKEQRKRLERALTTGRRGEDEYSTTALNKKALALVLHEVLWSFGLGGSCPLICGNCSDHPTDFTQGIHRCASKSTLRHRVISIGLH